MKNSLSDAVLAQFIMSPSQGGKVNLVNAAAFAKNKGIQVTDFVVTANLSKSCQSVNYMYNAFIIGLTHVTGNSEAHMADKPVGDWFARC